MNTYILSSGLAVLAGFMAMTYRGYAEKYGWAVGSVFYDRESWVTVFTWATVIPATIQLIYELSFLKGILVSVSLFFIAPIVICIFKIWSQIVLLVFIVLSVIIWVIGGFDVISI